MAEDGAKPLMATWFKLPPPIDSRRLPAHEYVENIVRTLEQEFAWHPKLADFKREFVDFYVELLDRRLPPGFASSGSDLRGIIMSIQRSVNSRYDSIVAQIKFEIRRSRRGHLGIMAPGSETDQRTRTENRDVSTDASDLSDASISPPADPIEEQRVILHRLRAHLERHTGVVDRFLDEVEGLVKEFRPRESATPASDTSSQPLLGTKQAAEFVGVTQNMIQKAAQAGKIGTEVSGRYLFSVSELEAFKHRDKPKGGRPKKNRSEG